MNDFFAFSNEILSILMLLLALRITTASTVHAMIPAYQYQSSALIAITLITAIETWVKNSPAASLVIGAFVLIPLALILLIEPLLAQATVFQQLSAGQRFRRLFRASARHEIHRQAVPIWLQARKPGSSLLGTIAFDLLIVVVAFVTAFRFNLMDPILPPLPALQSTLPSVVMAVSLALLLIGIVTMTRKDDIISQVIGLLVMEHGMFLGAMRLVADPSIKVLLVIALFLYTLVTLVILVVLLPELHHVSGAIDVRRQDVLKG